MRCTSRIGLVQGWTSGHVPRRPAPRGERHQRHEGALNGVPQLSRADGWWSEGYDGSNGWAIQPGQDDATDADELYRSSSRKSFLSITTGMPGVPHGWVKKMKHAMHIAGARFTAQRMVRQYLTDYYVPRSEARCPTIRPRHDDAHVEATAAADSRPRRAAAGTLAVAPVAAKERIGVTHLTAEYWPFARTGGLGEAVSGWRRCRPPPATRPP